MDDFKFLIIEDGDGLFLVTSKWTTWDFLFEEWVKVYFLVHHFSHYLLIIFLMQPEIPFLPVFSSMKRLIRYSLGSVALGSLILSFVESIRFMLESIRRKLKVSSTTPDNWFGKMVFHTSSFCLRCIECTIKSVNRNAYIMVIIWKLVSSIVAWNIIDIFQSNCSFMLAVIQAYACCSCRLL